MTAVPTPPSVAARAPADAAPDCDLDGAHIPHVAIHVFSETREFAAIWQQTSVDRRLASATRELFEGGFPAAIQRYASNSTPDLIIVETESDADILEYEADALAEVCDPGTQLVIVGHTNDIGLYQKMLGMGVANYLVFPISVASTIAAISEIYREPGKEKIGRVHAVIGARGGTGASTIAQNLALLLAGQRASDVLLADLDLNFGTAALNLDVEANHGLIELLDHSDRLDAAILDRLLVRRGLHLNLLGTSHGLEHGRTLDTAAVERIIEVAGSHVPQTVLDIPHQWNDWVERALVGADTVSVVATPELGSLRNAQTLMNRLKALRPNDKPPALVMNQVGMRRRQEIPEAEIASILGLKPVVSIGCDPRLFSQATSRGKLVVEIARRSQPVRALETLAEHLAPKRRTGAGQAARDRRSRA